jgi:hypothetical protein
MKVNKPRLVDEKVVEKIIKAQEESKPFSNIGPLIYNFFMNNIFVVCIFTFIGILEHVVLNRFYLDINLMYYIILSSRVLIKYFSLKLCNSQKKSVNKII